MKIFPKMIFLILLLLCPTVSADELQESLVGVWSHQGVSKSATSEIDPMKNAIIHWDFKADGKGEYYQKVSTLKMENRRPFAWQVSGKDILLNNGQAKYTVVSRSPDKMVWYNPLLGDYFHVIRQ